MDRRFFLEAMGVAVAAAVCAPMEGRAAKYQPTVRYLRPPGALPEDDFLNHCIRCGQCGEACPNRCINYFSFENGLASLDTPYIIPREKACILCMKCGDVCPTGAIRPIEREIDSIINGVRMGQGGRGPATVPVLPGQDLRCLLPCLPPAGCCHSSTASGAARGAG